MKYTEDVLREAVATSRTMADVLRHLGIPQNRGAHAHLRRRIDAFGIDTSHFLGRAHNRGRPSRQRLRPEDVLVLRAPDRRRAHPDVLRRALAESGISPRCSECGIGHWWNGKRLTLHVDHRNGDFWDCRLDNLRLLCPNCHSQTSTYAGRNRRTSAVQAPGGTSTRPPSVAQAPPQDEVLEIIQRVQRREITITAAAALIGCHRNHFYRLQRRLEETGSLAPRRARRRWRSAVHRDQVIAYALAHPLLGPKTIAERLRTLEEGGCRVSHGTVSNILREARLNTVAARRAAGTAGLHQRSETL